MASTLNTLKDAASALTPSSTPEAVQAFIEIGERFLVDILAMRGQSIEEWRAFRKQTIEAELAVVEAELAKVRDTDELPLP